MTRRCLFSCSKRPFAAKRRAKKSLWKAIFFWQELDFGSSDRCFVAQEVSPTQMKGLWPYASKNSVC